MNTRPERSKAEFQCRIYPVTSGITPKPYVSQRAMKQRGIVLFFALIALVVMSLAAVALIRSVDTSTMIAGNLAFKQSATTAGDAGLEIAVAWLARTQADEKAAGRDAYLNATHAFNNTTTAAGYYSNADDTAQNVTGSAVWNAINPALAFTDLAGNARTIGVTDASGNAILFIVQRMCRNAYPANDVRNIPDITNCLFSSAALDNSGQEVKLPQDMCLGAGCPSAGQTPQIRITVRVTGPRNTVSYIQSFVD